MVYLKINQEIKSLRDSIGLKNLVGCDPRCPTQVISYDHLSLLVDCHNSKAKKTNSPELNLQDLIDRTTLEYRMSDHMCLNIQKDEQQAH